ncbi:MAG: ATP-binding cassette domain-containing protein, partial [Candidatus Adiutrix sp.]|nr:ATP-binding cassette domain-containing protein [Candidatus Adiutrix sp.]
AWPGPARPLLVDDFIIREGQTIGLTGPNGSGKSSFFAALAGLGPERAGALRWFGQGQAKPADLVGRVGFLSQNPERQFFNETVREEVSFVLHRQNRPAGEAVGLADKWLGRLGLGPAAGQRPQELSFGQQHLLGLAMILASEPALLVLDEPFTGLDDGWRAYLKPFLSRGWPDYQPAVLILGHDEPAGLELDEIWRFQEGRVVTGQSASLSRPVAAIAEKRPPKRRFGYPGQYQPGHSRLHGCSPAWKFILMTLLASAAILTRSPWISLGVGLITAGLAASAGLAGAVFRDFKLLLLPVPLMVLFYCLRFSFDWSVVAEALAIGGRLIAAGLPFLLLQRSTDPERLQKSLKRFLSARNAFLLAAGAKIAPLIFRETLALAGLQRLRGARLYCKKIFRKEVINDWLMAFCLPLIIRVLELADQMSVIARLRGLEGNPAAPIHAQSGPQAPGEE